MHSSRMRTARCSGLLSCNAHPPTTHAPCHTCPPAMHTPWLCMPPPRPCMPPCHTCPLLPCMFPRHACTQPCMPPPHEQNDWQTGVKTLPCHNIVAGVTRMHSSRMHTIRCSGHWGGVCPTGVSDSWGLCPRGCLSERCLPSGRAVSAQGDGCLPGGVCPWGVYTPWTQRQIPSPPPVNTITDRCKIITFPTTVYLATTVADGKNVSRSENPFTQKYFCLQLKITSTGYDTISFSNKEAVWLMAKLFYVISKVMNRKNHDICGWLSCKISRILARFCHWIYEKCCWISQKWPTLTMKCRSYMSKAVQKPFCLE